MNDNELRKQVKLLKATEAIQNYYEIAEILEISESSMYNWLNRQFALSYDKKQLLKSVIEDLTLPE